VDYLKQAATKDHSSALYTLGWWYIQVKGVEKDQTAAFNCLKRSADLGNAEAQKLLQPLEGKYFTFKKPTEK